MDSNKLVNDKKVISFIDNEVKKYLKDNLKIEVEYNSPIGLYDGNIKVTIKLEGDIIDSDEHNIHRSFF